jgi:hypothetical protein
MNLFFSLATRHGGAWGERRYSSYSFLTSALDGGEWSASRPDRVLPRPRFAPGKGPPVPIVQKAGWASEPVWTKRLEEKSFAPAGDRTPIARGNKSYGFIKYTQFPGHLSKDSAPRNWFLNGLQFFCGTAFVVLVLLYQNKSVTFYASNSST